MFYQTLSIARNAFFESIRQPVLLVLVLAGMLLLMLSNPLSAFTMDDDQRMLLDIGLATVFTFGILIASFVASNVLGREIENKTALTVVSKPVPRPAFVIGKFLGVGFAISISMLLLSLVFVMVEQQAVLQTVRTPIHVPVVVFGTIALLVGTAVAVWCNYFYGFVFSSTWLCVTVPSMVIAYALVLNFGPDFSSQSFSFSFRVEIWKALLAIQVSVLILASIAIALSTRLGQLGTLSITFVIFFVGMMSDAWFGYPIDRIETTWLDRASRDGKVEIIEHVRVMEKINGDVEEVITEVEEVVAGVSLDSFAEGSEYPKWAAYKVGYAIVPNFQVLWLTDALTQNNVIPSSYLLRTTGYGAFYIIAAVSLGVVLFQRREVA
ncbi:MAG: ABC transporter permease [Phycisphaerae bacterium]|jgi:ABC-2 type transport system permease protein|nr:ABC transporter permease [Phycisphaerae bacterium]